MGNKYKKNKFIEAYEKGSTLTKFYKDKLGFDFECPNDFCVGRNGKRHLALAWKSDEVYKIYCDACGQNFSLTKDQFKNKKQTFSHEVALHNMEEDKKTSKRKRKTFLEDTPRLQAVYYDLDDKDKIQMYPVEYEEDFKPVSIDEQIADGVLDLSFDTEED